MFSVSVYFSEVSHIDRKIEIHQTIICTENWQRLHAEYNTRDR